MAAGACAPAPAGIVRKRARRRRTPFRPRAFLFPHSKTNDKGQATNDQQLTTDYGPLTTRAFPPRSSLIIHRSAFSFPLPPSPCPPWFPLLPLLRFLMCKSAVLPPCSNRSLPHHPPFPSLPSVQILPPAGSVSPCLRGENSAAKIPAILSQSHNQKLYVSRHSPAPGADKTPEFRPANRKSGQNAKIPFRQFAITNVICNSPYLIHRPSLLRLCLLDSWLPYKSLTCSVGQAGHHRPDGRSQWRAPPVAGGRRWSVCPS